MRGRERILMRDADAGALRRFRAVRHCGQCGMTFGHQRKNSPFCSDACATAHEVDERCARAAALTAARCEECHGPVPLNVNVPRTRFCSAGCANRYNCRNRRGRIKGRFVAPVSLGEIAERDGGLCHICEAPVDLAAIAPHPRSPALDHVIPLARGGEHGPHNVALAHFLCNSRKGAA